MRDEAVFFDVGGTLLVGSYELADLVFTVLHGRGLVRSRDRVSQAVARVDAARDPASLLDDELRPEAARVRAVFEDLALERDAPDLVADLRSRVIGGEALVLAPGALAALGLLARAGFRIGVISNWDETLPDVLARTGVAPYLAALAFSWEVGARKPDRRIFETALARIGAEPARSWHVGDDPDADVAGAIASGMRAVQILGASGEHRASPGVALAAVRVDEAVRGILDALGGPDRRPKPLC